jgi:DNA-binding response OmpR family regulator
MAKKTILVVDDEEDILELVRFHLAREGYAVLSAQTGEQAWRMVREQRVDLALVDLMLPGIDGLELTRRLKNDSRTAPIPVVMLTAKGEEVDIVTGLELGADDYVTKPFSPRVLLARLRAVFRRRAAPVPGGSEVVQISGLTIDGVRRRLTIDDEVVDLTFTEFEVLAFLTARPGWVFTRSQIVDAVRGDDYPVTDRSVDVQIVGLRRKLGARGHLIETVRGVGYRFKDEKQ